MNYLINLSTSFFNIFLLFPIISIGTVPDTLPTAYTTAALPQYGGGLYSPTPLANTNLTATASIAAGKQIEGKFFFHLLSFSYFILPEAKKDLFFFFLYFDVRM